MARGNEIVVSANPRGVRMEGYIGAGLTPKPGTLMQIDPTVAIKGGRHTYKLQTPGADGALHKGPLFVLEADHLQGKTCNDAYAAGDRCFLYCPLPGEEVNVLLADVAGTGDVHAAGEELILQNATGQLIATTGSPAERPFMLLEAIAAPTAATLAWCVRS